MSRGVARMITRKEESEMSKDALGRDMLEVMFEAFSGHSLATQSVRTSRTGGVSVDLGQGLV